MVATFFSMRSSLRWRNRKGCARGAWGRPPGQSAPGPVLLRRRLHLHFHGERLALLQEVVGIDRPSGRLVDAVVEVGGVDRGVAGVADVADDLAGLDPVADLLEAEVLEVGVVEAIAARAGDRHHLAAEPLHALEFDDPRGGAADRRVARREDVDPLVMPAAVPRGAPGVLQVARRHAVHRDRQRAWKLFLEKGVVAGVVADGGLAATREREGDEQGETEETRTSHLHLQARPQRTLPVESGPHPEFIEPNGEG